jgi:UDP-N-acetyl-2-amino-2-deoxyglucuronate dehydrogenase
MYKFAIIGCGGIAGHHAAEIARIGKLEAVCDTDPAKAEKLANTYQAKAYDDLEVLLRDETIDVVSICTPNGYHAEHCIRSLQANKHVLCESPLCLTKAAAWQIMETEKFCRRTLFVVNAARYQPVFDELEKKIRENNSEGCRFHLDCSADGSRDYQDWRSRIFPGGGALYTGFSNGIDALTRLFCAITEAKGFSDGPGNNVPVEFEDTGVVSLRMENKTVGSLQWSVREQNDRGIHGVVFTANGSLKFSGEDLDMTRNNRYAATYDAFLQRIGSGTGTSGVYEGLATVEGIEKIYKAVLKPSILP